MAEPEIDYEAARRIQQRRKSIRTLAARERPTTLKEAGASVYFAARAVQAQEDDAARLADPVEQARIALQRRGRIVYRMTVHGGRADRWFVTGLGKDVTDEQLLAAADRLSAPAHAPGPAPTFTPSPKPRSQESAMKRQVNIHVEQELFDRLAGRAAREGISTAQMARRLFEAGARDDAAGGEPMVELSSKPKVPAEVLRAANEAGADLHAFCSKLLALGLAVWIEDQAEAG